MKVGIIQQANTANIEENIGKLRATVRSLAKQGAELIVMQEIHNGLYFC
ncbi:MAG: acyltransferase, partial [Dysgonamonadaceae bacterium]